MFYRVSHQHPYRDDVVVDFDTLEQVKNYIENTYTTRYLYGLYNVSILKVVEKIDAKQLMEDG